MEPNEQFGFDWDMTVSSEDCGFEAEPQDLHNTVEGEEAVFELLSGLNTLSHLHQHSDAACPHDSRCAG